MIEPKNPVLARMLERLFAAMVNGPAMNCRPHASRQRLDLSQFARLQCTTPGELLAAVLGQDRQAKVGARVPAPPKAIAAVTAVTEEEEGENLLPEERAARKAWSEQQSLLNKLRVIADDARTYEQDTGVYVLEIGFPLTALKSISILARTAGLLAHLQEEAQRPIGFIMSNAAADAITYDGQVAQKR